MKDYDETDTGTGYTVTYGDVSVADLRTWNTWTPATLLADLLDILVARGVPGYERGLVHEIAVLAFSSTGGGGV